MARLIVDTVAGLPSSVAPAPLALLTRNSPVRAVFGHVEPTFDWTLRDPETKQRFGHDIIAALTSRLHLGQPLGLILENYYSGVGSLVSAWATRSDEFQDSPDQSILEEMTRLRLTAWDRQSLVLLGDPTVRIPKLANLEQAPAPAAREGIQQKFTGLRPSNGAVTSGAIGSARGRFG